MRSYSRRRAPDLCHSGDKTPHAARPWSQLGRSNAQRDAAIPPRIESPSAVPRVGVHEPRDYRDLSITEDGGAEGGCGLGLHAGHDVLVDGHRERNAAVA